LRDLPKTQFYGDALTTWKLQHNWYTELYKIFEEHDCLSLLERDNSIQSLTKAKATSITDDTLTISRIELNFTNTILSKMHKSTSMLDNQLGNDENYCEKLDNAGPWHLVRLKPT